MNKTSIHIFSVVILFLATISTVQAEDSLTALMQRIKANPASKVTYQETRTLKLLTEPWHGSGYLYSLPPDLMIREQLQPERLLMGVKGNKTYYYDIKNDSRHQAEMDGDSEENMPLAVFKAIVNADEILLRKVYDIEFSTSEGAWSMNLKPKQSSGSISRIIVSGLSEQPANKVSIMQEGGDLSEFILQKESGASKDNAAINKLFHELQGE